MGEVEGITKELSISNPDKRNDTYSMHNLDFVVDAAPLPVVHCLLLLPHLLAHLLALEIVVLKSGVRRNVIRALRLRFIGNCGGIFPNCSPEFHTLSTMSNTWQLIRQPMLLSTS